jgi:hypothetical protein
MITYKQLQRHPVSGRLFNSRITTMDGLRNLQSNGTAFIALDTEHFAVSNESDRVLHQVGLAYMEAVVGKPSAQPACTRLQDFHTLSAARVFTLNIDMNKRRDNIIGIRGGIPARRPSRFGQEQQIQLEDLEVAVIDFIQGCEGSRGLVLMGFGMAAEWEYLFQCFPRTMHYFIAWADLRDIGSDIAPLGVLPTLTGVLKVFGYSWKSLKPGRRDGTKTGTADNASDDALATLALAQALLEPENQQKLKFCQACSHIARFDRKGYRDPSLRRSLVASVESRNGILPQSIDSGMKLACKFFDFAPSYTGRISEEQAYLAFTDKDNLDRFIQHADGLVLPTGDTLSARQLKPTDSPDTEAREAEEVGQRRQKQELREQQRIERSKQDGPEDLGSLFLD